jgi:hypothetical protein
LACVSIEASRRAMILILDFSLHFFEVSALQIRLRSVLAGDMNSPCSSLWQP